MMELSGRKCLINTGNILSLNEITRKSGLNPTEELLEAINITVKEFGTDFPSNEKLIIQRPTDDLHTKIEEQSLSDLKIGLKVFLNNDCKVSLKEAIDEGFATLKVPSIQNVILQFTNKETLIEGGDSITCLQKIWGVLEDYVKNEKINQIGLADVEENTFRCIFEWALIKPTIIQINLATCCVVPPTLQQFCKDNDVQLLTHSDPIDILPINLVKDLVGLTLPIKWVSRFLVHIKCRGVLCSKGYLISLGED